MPEKMLERVKHLVAEKVNSEKIKADIPSEINLG